MKRVDIRDFGNSKRLLGTIDISELPFPEPSCDIMRMAILRSLSPVWRPSPDDPIISPSLDYITLTVDWRKDAWEAKAFLKTYDKLEDLMCLKTFRLPGEGEYEAGRRR